MKIRHSEERDIPEMMQIYERARVFMAEHGNPNQWGPTTWPPKDLLKSDIDSGCSYVCVDDTGRVIGTFFFTKGKEVEPTYKEIFEGEWLDESPYGVVHRVASDGTVKGVGRFCINWALEQCDHMRMDTHGDNKVMQNLLESMGFVRCGIIHVVEDSYPRLAYEKL